MGDKGKWKREFNLSYSKENNVRDSFVNRNRRLKELGLTYSEYLQSKEWKTVKQKASERDFYKKCRKCGTSKNIHLHHKNYKWLGTPHALSALIPLCKCCHKEVHDISQQTGLNIQVATRKYLRGKISLIKNQEHLFRKT